MTSPGLRRCWLAPPTGPLEIVLEELSSVVRQADEVAAAVANGDADGSPTACRRAGLPRVRRSVEWLGVRLASVDDLRRRSRHVPRTLLSSPKPASRCGSPCEWPSRQAAGRGTAPTGSRKAPTASSLLDPAGERRGNPCPQARHRTRRGVLWYRWSSPRATGAPTSSACSTG